MRVLYLVGNGIAQIRSLKSPSSRGVGFFKSNEFPSAQKPLGSDSSLPTRSCRSLSVPNRSGLRHTLGGFCGRPSALVEWFLIANTKWDRLGRRAGMEMERDPKRRLRLRGCAGGGVLRGTPLAAMRCHGVEVRATGLPARRMNPPVGHFQIE